MKAKDTQEKWTEFPNIQSEGLKKYILKITKVWKEELMLPLQL